jgi:predicted Zn-dependent protease
MAAFFDRMERLMRPGSGGIDVPEFLQTHPVTSTRISEAKALAHVIKQREAAHPRSNVADDTRWKSTLAPLPYVHAHGQLATRAAASAGDYDDYRLMRERVRVLTARNNNDMIDYYKHNFAGQRGFDGPATRYGYALALTRGNRGGEAVAQLQPLIDKQPQSLPLQLALADAQLHAGQRAKALAVYATLAKRLPDNHAVADAYADALLASGSVDDARKAAALLRPLLDEEVDEPTLYRTYGRACERAGQEVRAGEAFADATYLSGRATDALDQLRRLLKRKDLDYYQRARIQARIEYITPIALELHRRGITADQQGM